MNALFWITSAVISLILLMPPSGLMGVRSQAVALLAGLMILNAAAMLIAGVTLRQRKPVFYFFALAVLAVNILLTITDEFGFVDLITLIIDLILAVVLIRKYKYFTGFQWVRT